jgi:hypothetical protein
MSAIVDALTVLSAGSIEATNARECPYGLPSPAEHNTDRPNVCIWSWRLARGCAQTQELANMMARTVQVDSLTKARESCVVSRHCLRF